MSLSKLALKITIILAALFVPSIWLVTTNSGLNTALKVASWFSPVKVNYANAEGNLLTKPITIRDITVIQNEQKITVGAITIDWVQKTFNANEIRGFEHFLPAQDLLAIDKLAVIEEIHGKITLQNDQQVFDVKLLGIWQQAPLSGLIRASLKQDIWRLHNSNIKIADNIFSIRPTSKMGYSWQLKLPQPQLILKAGYGAINATGSIDNVMHIPVINAHIIADKFGFEGYSVKKLRATVKIPSTINEPLNVVAAAETLVFDNNLLNSLKLNASGSLSKHSIDCRAKYDKSPIRISANGKVENTTWSSKNLNFNYQLQTLSGDASYNLANNKLSANLHGQPFAINTKIHAQADNLNDVNLKVDLHTNNANNLHADLKLKANKIDGQATVNATDFSLIMQLLPDITRVKGNLTAEAKISGTINNPIVLVNANMTQITATIPALGVKIKPMELHIKGNADGKYILTGKGKMRRGPGEFTVNGFIEPFKDNMPNKLTIVSTDLEFVNNETAHLIAANSLDFSYDMADSRLDISGDIDIQSGEINFNGNKTSIIKSKDVIFVNEEAIAKKENISINPDINLRISEGVRFKGFGLDADITGKLDINQRHETIYGTGRVTIKQGTYQLPGQKLQIQKGRLLYPPGTLLANPALDIKMQGQNQVGPNENVNVGSDLEIIVQGTAQTPIIHESGLGDNKDKALSQALLTGSSMLTNNFLQDKFKLSQLGLANHDDDHPDFFDKHTQKQSLMKNKDIVVGRPLGKHFYLQYLHSMGEENKRVRLKYALGKHWAVGVETGDQGGGADLSFAIEKD